jgi:hypothetical protein
MLVDQSAHVIPANGRLKLSWVYLVMVKSCSVIYHYCFHVRIFSLIELALEPTGLKKLNCLFPLHIT